MTQKEINEQRYSILKAVEKQFTDELIPARLVEAEYNDDETVKKPEILTVLMEGLVSDGVGAVGEFLFVPSRPEDEVWTFNNVLTIEGEIESDALGEVLSAINLLNTMIPVGAFIVDMSKNAVAYRYAYTMRANLSDEALSDTVDLIMGNAVETVQRFGYIIHEVASGQRNAESIFGLIQTAE